MPTAGLRMAQLAFLPGIWRWMANAPTLTARTALGTHSESWRAVRGEAALIYPGPIGLSVKMLFAFNAFTVGPPSAVLRRSTAGARGGAFAVRGGPVAHAMHMRQATHWRRARHFMKYKLATAGVVAVALVISTASVAGFGRQSADAAAAPATWRLEDYDKVRPGDNVILKWNRQLLDTIEANPAGTGPTVTARALGVLHTATYDAWAAYDPVAKGTRLGSTLRRTNAAERTLENKSKAISFAAYKTLSWLFPTRESNYRAQLAALYPQYATDTSTPVTVGNKAAEAVIAYRSSDGSNQTLNSNGTVSYPCATGGNACSYSATNTWNNVADPWKWQPLCVLTPAGVGNKLPMNRDPSSTCPAAPDYALQGPLTPQWGKVAPFSAAPSTYAVNGPPRDIRGNFLTADIDRALTETTGIDDRKKTLAEYWADGPGSVFPPGHDFIFAAALSRVRGHTLDQDVKLFFMLGNAMMDASIASWYQKYKWDFVRPITAIRHRYKDKPVTSWLGPGLPHGQDFGTVMGQNWQPYQALNVVTPGFPEYVSGHSTFSGAGYSILNSFTGTNTFGAVVTVKAGTSQIDPGTTPATDITFTLATWSQTGEDAGTSRRYGGIHFWTGDNNGRALGRQVATNVYAKATLYITGRSQG
jgi:hypothetical protein